MAGADFSLVAADSAAGIVLEYEATAAILLRVESIPAEPLRLRLQALVPTMASVRAFAC